jgi:hypothetical protein
VDLKEEEARKILGPVVRLGVAGIVRNLPEKPAGTVAKRERSGPKREKPFQKKWKPYKWKLPFIETSIISNFNFR